MKIYRIERNGFGPYQFCEKSLVREKMTDCHCDNFMRPVPDYSQFVSFSKLLGVSEEKIIFGCPSLESLEAWFLGYTDDLETEGFQVLEYETDDAVFFRPYPEAIPQIAFTK